MDPPWGPEGVAGMWAAKVWGGRGLGRRKGRDSRAANKKSDDCAGMFNDV